MPEETAIVPKDLETAAVTWPERAQAMVIASQEDYDQAGALRRDVLKVLRQQIVAHHQPLKQAADEAHKKIVAAEKRLLAPIDQADKILEEKRLVYYTQKERERLAEEARLAEIARKEEDDRKLAAAAAAEQAGVAPEDVDAMLEQESTAPPPAAPPTVVKSQGISIRGTWKRQLLGATDAERLKNLLLVVRHVAKHPYLIGLLEFNQSGANSEAKASKGMVQVPGTRVYEDKSEVVR